MRRVNAHQGSSLSEGFYNVIIFEWSSLIDICLHLALQCLKRLFRISIFLFVKSGCTHIYEKDSECKNGD